MLLNYHIDRFVLVSLCVGDLVRLGLSSIRVAVAFTFFFFLLYFCIWLFSSFLISVFLSFTLCVILSSFPVAHAEYCQRKGVPLVVPAYQVIPSSCTIITLEELFCQGRAVMT